MKKPIIACILTALLSIVAIGQNLKKDIDVELGPSFKLAKRAFHMDIIPLENGEFIAVEGVGRSARKEFDLIHFNAKMKEINRSTIELKVGKDLHGYEKLYYKNGELVLFTSLGNKKADFSKLFYQKIQLKTLKPTKQIIQVDEAVSKRGTSPFIINFSSDGSKLLVYKSNSVDKDEPLSYGVKILNAAGNLSVIWEKDLVSELSSELEDIKKIGVNNKGDVFLSSLQYKGKRKAVVNNEPNFSFVLKEYSDGGKKLNTYPITLDGVFMTDMSIGLNDNDEIICTGFYSDRGTYGIKGCYYMLLDASTKSIVKKSKKEFSLDFITENLSERKTKKVEKKNAKGKEIELPNYNLDDIIMREDGGVIQVAERFYITTHYTTDSQGNTRVTYVYHYDDLIVISISPEGEIEWTRKIRKAQASSNGPSLLSSYHLSVSNNKLYFFHNGNAENLLIGPKDKLKGWVLNKKACGIVTEINEEGYMRSDIFMDVASHSAIPYIRIGTNLSSNEILFFGTYKKDTKYLKVRLPKE